MSRRVRLILLTLTVVMGLFIVVLIAVPTSPTDEETQARAIRLALAAGLLARVADDCGLTSNRIKTARARFDSMVSYTHDKSSYVDENTGTPISNSEIWAILDSLEDHIKDFQKVLEDAGC